MRMPLGEDVFASIPVRSGPPVNVTARVEERVTGTVIVAAQPAAVEVIRGNSRRRRRCAPS
jgi:hypothetical protein